MSTRRTVSSAREVAAALFAALEPVAHVVAYNGEFREEVTRDYRYSFTVDFDQEPMTPHDP